MTLVYIGVGSSMLLWQLLFCMRFGVVESVRVNFTDQIHLVWRNITPSEPAYVIDSPPYCACLSYFGNLNFTVHVISVPTRLRWIHQSSNSGALSWRNCWNTTWWNFHLPTFSLYTKQLSYAGRHNSIYIYKSLHSDLIGVTDGASTFLFILAIWLFIIFCISVVKLINRDNRFLLHYTVRTSGHSVHKEHWSTSPFVCA